MVANHLLETNPVSESDTSEQAANIRQNLADCLEVLPKLLTGVDVNPQFSGIKAFEFTTEVSLFDLLDISLVHGWLYDPTDLQVAEALGTRSYNEVVLQLAEALGAAAVQSRLSSRGLNTAQLSKIREQDAGSAIDLGTQLQQTPTASAAIASDADAAQDPAQAAKKDEAAATDVMSRIPEEPTAEAEDAGG